MEINPFRNRMPVTNVGPLVRTAVSVPSSPVPVDSFVQNAQLTGTSPSAGASADLLDGVRNGTVTLSGGAKGEPVQRMQQLLETAGYDLSKDGVSGEFGDGTKAALQKFQKSAGIDPATGKLDSATLTKLEAAAAKKAKSPEYDKLYKDGVLNGTLAVGFDEGGAHKNEIRKLVAGLTSQGFNQVDLKNKSEDEIKRLGLDPKKVDKDADYFVKQYTYNGKPVTAAYKLITPDTPNAKEKFSKAIGEDEVVMYTGHGRYGSGPDFDDKHDPAGNFVIRKPTDPSKVAVGENDLKKTKMTDDYQLFFFDGCNTKKYMPNLRAIPPNKDTENLDVVGANTELDWGTSASDVLAMVGGIAQGKSINDIQYGLEAINKKGPNDRQRHFMTDGFGDNAKPGAAK